MDENLCKQLPLPTQKNVREIERQIGAELLLVPLPADVQTDIGGNLPALICERRNGRVTVEIGLPQSGEICIESVTHEVIHARRNIVERVPRLAINGKSLQGTPLMIENDLEHMFVVPEEIAFYKNRVQYWESDLSRALTSITNQLDKSEYPEFAKARLIHIFLINPHIYPGWTGFSILEKLLTERDLMFKAKELRRSFDRLWKDKSKAITFMVKLYDFDPALFHIAQWRAGQAKDLVRPLSPA